MTINMYMNVYVKLILPAAENSSYRTLIGERISAITSETKFIEHIYHQNEIVVIQKKKLRRTKIYRHTL